MKALSLARYGSPDALRLEDVETPTPKDGEVLIRVRAASVNDWDWCLVRGSPFYMRLLCGFFVPRIRIPGTDIAGVVAAVGPKAVRFKPGDAVYGDLSESGFGGFAEYVCARESALALKPPGLSFAEAAALPHAANLAAQGLRDVGNLQPGQSLLINGAGGGVGTLALQIAKSLGASRVDGVDSGPKLERLRALGFDSVLDYAQTDFTRSGERYDLILDPKTNRSPFAYLRALTPQGRYATVGGATTRLLQAFLLGPIIARFTSKRIRILALKPNKDLAYISQLCEAGQLRPAIDSVHPLRDAAKAIARFGSGAHLGKVVVEIGK